MQKQISELIASSAQVRGTGIARRLRTLSKKLKTKMLLSLCMVMFLQGFTHRGLGT